MYLFPNPLGPASANLPPTPLAEHPPGMMHDRWAGTVPKHPTSAPGHRSSRERSRLDLPHPAACSKLREL